MPRPRRPVEPLQQALSLQPVARSPDFFQRPNLAEPTRVPVYDFAPISETVTGYLAQQAKDRGERQVQEGQRFADENPALVQRLEAEAAAIKDNEARSDFLRREFARLRKEGKIRSAADPYFQIGYARSAARQTVAAYRQRVQDRLSQVTAVKDPQTGEYTQPVDPDTILAQEWERAANSPSVLNFYGGQEALAAKEGVDEEFRARAGKGRADAIEKDYLDNLTNDIGTQFDAVLTANHEVNSATLQPVTDYITQEVKSHNVPNPRELVLQSLKLSLQRLAATDPREAVRAAYAAQDLVVGGVRLGDDRSGVGQELENLKRRYLDEERVHDARETQSIEDRRALAIRRAEDEYLPALIAAKKSGQSITQVARDTSERILREDADSQKYDGQAAFIVEALDERARVLDSKRQSDQSVVQRINALSADGKLDEAEQLARASMSGGQLSGEDYASALSALDQRRNVSQYVEQDALFQSVRASYDQAKPSGLSNEIQDGIDNRVLDLQRNLDRDLAAWVQDNLGQPGFESKRRTWIQERQEADLGDIRDRAYELRAKRDETDRDIRGRFGRFQDATDLIDQGERTGAFTIEEAQGLREQNTKAAGLRDQFYAMPEYGQALSQLEQSFRPDERVPMDPDQVPLLNAARQELRDRYDLALDKMLGDQSVNPRNFLGQARSLLRTTQRELEQQLFPEAKVAKAQAELGVKAGQPAAAISARTTALQVDLEAAGQWAPLLRDPAAREALNGKSPLFAHHPAVPDRFYDRAALWMSGVDPFFGSPVGGQDMRSEAHRVAAGIAADPSLPDDQRQEAIGAVVSTVGISPTDVLQDRVTFRPGPDEVQDAKRRIQTLEYTMAHGGPGLRARVEIQAQIDRLRGVASPTENGVTADLRGYIYRPYTTPFFRSRTELEAYSGDVAYPDFLRRIGIDPTDQDAVHLWEAHQILSMDRTSR